MAVGTDNLRRWIEQSDIDYISHYIKVWIPFNAWYNSSYADLNTDREKINSIKNNGNLIRSKLNILMERDGQEHHEFRNFLGSLYHELEDIEIIGRDGRIWFRDIVKEINPENQISEDYRNVRYFLKIDRSNNRVSNVNITIKKNSSNNAMIYRKTFSVYDINEVKSYSDYRALTPTQQDHLRYLFAKLEPLKTIDLIQGTPSDSPQNYYKCDNLKLKRNTTGSPDQADLICKALIEILYQLRNVVFHGELVPNAESQKVYKNAYFCLRYLLEAVK